MVVNGGGERTIAPVQVLALTMCSFALSLAPTVTSIRLSLFLLSYFLCYGCSGSVFVLLGVVGLGFEEGFALVLV